MKNDKLIHVVLSAADRETLLKWATHHDLPYTKMLRIMIRAYAPDADYDANPSAHTLTEIYGKH